MSEAERDIYMDWCDYRDDVFDEMLERRYPKRDRKALPLSWDDDYEDDGDFWDDDPNL